MSHLTAVVRDVSLTRFNNISTQGNALLWTRKLMLRYFHPRQHTTVDKEAYVGLSIIQQLIIHQSVTRLYEIYVNCVFKAASSTGSTHRESGSFMFRCVVCVWLRYRIEDAHLSTFTLLAFTLAVDNLLHSFIKWMEAPISGRIRCTYLLYVVYLL